MNLNLQDRAVFFKLYFDLLYCVNKKHRIVEKFCEGRFPKSVDTQKACDIREKLFDNPKWIDEYLSVYGKEYTDEERDIIISWREHFIKGEFFVVRNLKKYSVFMRSGNEPGTERLYGVVGLNHPISELFDTSYLPVMVNALLLPYKGMIIYDGMVTSQTIRFGSNMRKIFKDSYRLSKQKFGIIESLPFDGMPKNNIAKLPVQKAKGKSGKIKDERIEEITEMITDFCDKHLNKEYAEMSLRLLEKLRRKRPSPLLKGRVNTWACGIVHAIGSTNFLFDKSQTPHMRASDIASYFGISQSTAGNKAGEIYKLVKMSPLDPDWTLPSKLADNPLVWMIESNDGFIFDARTAPREIQERLFAAGIIPFIPTSDE